MGLKVSETAVLPGALLSAWVFKTANHVWPKIGYERFNDGIDLHFRPPAWPPTLATSVGGLLVRRRTSNPLQRAAAPTFEGLRNPPQG